MKTFFIKVVHNMSCDILAEKHIKNVTQSDEKWTYWSIEEIKSFLYIHVYNVSSKCVAKCPSRYTTLFQPDTIIYFWDRGWNSKEYLSTPLLSRKAGAGSAGVTIYMEDFPHNPNKATARAILGSHRWPLTSKSTAICFADNRFCKSLVYIVWTDCPLVVLFLCHAP